MRLYYQPIVPLGDTTDTHSHNEILVRMLDDSGTIIPPGAFIPSAERYGQMGEIDRWVVHTALNSYPASVTTPPNTRVAINLSGASLSDETFWTFLQNELMNAPIPPDQVCFEITETAAIHNINKALRFMNKMKTLGCRFALDDFGSGLSSFAYLKKMPVDYLKIEASFVEDIVDDPVDHAMVAAINEVGKIMGLQTIAEGVSNDTVADALRELGVDYGQGYALQVPLPLNGISTPHITPMVSPASESKTAPPLKRSQQR